MIYLYIFIFYRIFNGYDKNHTRARKREGERERETPREGEREGEGRRGEGEEDIRVVCSTKQDLKRCFPLTRTLQCVWNSACLLGTCARARGAPLLYFRRSVSVKRSMLPLSSSLFSV